MPGLPTLKPETTTLQTLRKHWIFLLVRVQSEPLAASFAAPLVAFGPQWDTVAKQATTLSDALYQARASAIFAGDVLNQLAAQVSAAIHEGKKADVSLPLHQLYFGSSTVSQTERPSLGTQLSSMRPWPGLLAIATQPELLALAPLVTEGVAVADVVETHREAAQSNEDKFELDGELRQLFDDYNALAATTFEGLKAIVHDQPELKLGGDWAESFFLHESRAQVATTLAQATAEVKKLQDDLAAAQQRLVELKAKQTAAEAAEAAAQAAVVPRLTSEGASSGT